MTHKQLTILLFEGDEGHDCSVQRRVAPDPARAGGLLEKKMIHSSHMDQIWLVVSGGLKASKGKRVLFNQPSEAPRLVPSMVIVLRDC